MQQPPTLRHDLAGGLVSAAVGIPLAMGFGMFAFVSLGDHYLATGARAGLLTAFLVAVVMVVLGDRRAAIYAPRVNSTFFIGALLYGLVHSENGVLQSASTSLILAVLFAIILLGAVFQLLFGLARVGTLIKFAPHPVMAGFQNTAAILLFLVQLSNVSGFDETRPFTFVLGHLSEVKPLSIVIAALTFAVMWNSAKISRRVPPVLVALAFGTGAYYALIAAGLGGRLGPTIGSATHATLGPAVWLGIGDIAQVETIAALWPTILGGGLALAIVASIDALLCSRLISQPGDARVDADRFLARLGVGNIASAAFGGITGGINIGPSLTNRAFGGHSRLSVVVNAIAIALAFTVLFPIVGELPRVVLSAVIMVIAVQHLDKWSLQLIRRVTFNAGGQRRSLALDLLVVVVVAALAVAVNIVLAVFLGVLIAGALFVVRMSHSIIRRSYRGDEIGSRKSRVATEMAALERRGSAILVIELQGALFFGTGDRLADEIAGVTEAETRCLILDLRRISEVDSTGALMILAIQSDAARSGTCLALTLDNRSELQNRLAELGVLEKIPSGLVFEDVDRAVEWAEDQILREELDEIAPAEEIALDRVEILQGLGASGIAALRTYLTRAVYPKGSIIFTQGDAGTELFILTKGRVSAYVSHPAGGTVRLATFAPGTVFGEVAILDAGPRSASMIADDEVVSYALSQVRFTEICREAPAVAIALLAALGGQLSGRLRRANRAILHLQT